MELADYLRMLRAHWLGFVLLVALGVGAAAAYTFTQEKVYAANANGFVTAGTSSDPALASVNDTVAKSRVKSYVKIATSRATAERVIDDLGLEADPARLIGNITVDQPPDTVILEITATSSSPSQAQQLADAWVAALAEEVEEVENPDGKTAGAVTRVVPVESAALPTSPVSPRPELNLAVGLAAGLLLGLAYALVRSQLDRRLRVAWDLEKRFGVAVVGTIPEAAPLERSRGVLPLATTADARSEAATAAESFRKLRTNLAFMDVDDPPRVIVVTSPHQGDGKSTVAANLAAAIAASGQPVTLVDGDLRRPSVAQSLELVEGAGLTDVLIGRAEVGDVLQAHPTVPGLCVLAAGSIPPNPSELLGSKSMRGVLDELSASGMVVVDAPPLLPVTDAAVLTAHCDGALVVVSYGRTRDTDLGDALAHLTAVQGRVLGVIFNKVPRRNTAGGYYGDYYRSDRTPAPEVKRPTPAPRPRGGSRAKR